MAFSKDTCFRVSLTSPIVTLDPDVSETKILLEAGQLREHRGIMNLPPVVVLRRWLNTAPYSIGIDDRRWVARAMLVNHDSTRTILAASTTNVISVMSRLPKSVIIYWILFAFQVSAPPPSLDSRAFTRSWRDVPGLCRRTFEQVPTGVTPFTPVTKFERVTPVSEGEEDVIEMHWTRNGWLKDGIKGFNSWGISSLPSYEY